MFFKSEFRGFLFFLLASGLSNVVLGEWVTHDFDVMGTRASVVLWEEDTLKAQQLVNNVEQEMQRIEQLMSPYIADSELSAINRLEKNKTLSISLELYRVIDKALYFSKITQGAFDISFASVGFLYDYRKGIRPDEDVLAQSLAAIDYRSIHLHQSIRKRDQPTLQFFRDGMKIDLGGIAKGYAVDRSIALLKAGRVMSGLVSAGGDTRIIGNRGFDKNSIPIPWVMGIQHPRSQNEQALRLPLSDTAMSTSGDYERFFLVDDERVHHIIHPDSGKSAKSMVSATIIGPESIDCDALSTSVFVLGIEAGLVLINGIADYEAILIDNSGKVHYSKGLQPQS